MGIHSSTLNVSRGRRRSALFRVVTVFGQKEFASLQAFCKLRRISLYSLAKASIREYVRLHA